MDTVADQFGGNFFSLKDGADKARLPMVERRHAIEEMRGMARAGRNRGLRFVVART